MEKYVNKPYNTDISYYIPKDVIAAESRKAFLSNLIITIIGFYDKAYNHSIYRDGIPEYIMLYCVGGKGWLETGGKHFDLAKGDLILLDRDVPHSYGADKLNPWSIHWVHFMGKAIPELLEALEVTPESPVLSIGEIPELVALVVEAYTLLSSGYGHVNLLHASTCFQEFLCRVLRLKVYSGVTDNKTPDIDNVFDYMLKNINSNCNLSQLAASINMSKYHFVRMFKHRTGYTPLEYFNRLKIQRACELLDTTGKSIKEISDILSFSSPFYFSEVFKRITGFSPKQYRSLHKIAPQ